ncbi:DUF6089 family protein [Hymenobacter busanensis]|nr:DUF6089 family protein [Hymenobacter busanensis]QHJ08693.1 outer membrane beta-barrel protein [Hymenobacter busanensis]
MGSAFFALHAQAQNTSEVGIGLGGLAYKGELSPEYRLSNNRPAVFAFYRKDISVPITLRANVAYGMLRAADTNVTGENGNVLPLAAARQASMSGNLLELAGIAEYNFLDYRNRRDKVHFTPYVFVGVAPFLSRVRTTGPQPGFTAANTMVGFAFPAGVGMKLALSRRWNLGIEAGARKAFTDMLDNVSEQSPAFANSHDQDWYYLGGLSVSYTFYKIQCPESYKANPKLLR